MDRNTFQDIEIDTDNILEYQANFLYTTIFKDDLPRHFEVFGKSGSGKTRAILALLISIKDETKKNKGE